MAVYRKLSTLNAIWIAHHASLGTIWTETKHVRLGKGWSDRESSDGGDAVSEHVQHRGHVSKGTVMLYQVRT
jgi:hypothetical protein